MAAKEAVGTVACDPKEVAMCLLTTSAPWELLGWQPAAAQVEHALCVVRLPAAETELHLEHAGHRLEDPALHALDLEDLDEVAEHSVCTALRFVLQPNYEVRPLLAFSRV
mgnify:CR=1 FL=1